MKTLRKTISLLVAVLMLAALVPAVVSADTAPLTVSEIWSLMSGREYKSAEPYENYRNNTLTAVTDGDARVFRFSDGKHTVDVKADDINEPLYDYYENGTDGRFYFVYGTDGSVDILVKDGVVMHMRIYDESLYDYSDEEYDLSGNYIDASLSELGTEDYPWMLGELRVFIVDGALWVDGEGEIPDYDKDALGTRIWDSFSDEIDNIFISGNITRIGKNSFCGVGKNRPDGQAVSIDFYSDSLEEIGESAFEGVPACYQLFIPETVKVIGPRAFADTKIDDFVLYCTPDEIADDAFAGVTAKIGTKCGQWDDAKKLSYGGDLTYYDIYSVHIAYMADGEDRGWMEMDIYAGDPFETELEEEYDIGYIFDHAELVSGTVDGFDGSARELSFVPCDNVNITAYYVYSEEAAAAHEGEDDGSFIFDGNIDGEELAEMILENDTVSKAVKTFAAITTAIVVIIVAGIAVGIFFIVRAIVKKNKKKKADDNTENK